MKKKFQNLLCILLIATLPFSLTVLSDENQENSGMNWNGDITEYYYGSWNYWVVQINEGTWDYTTRPEPLMGDANIDGVVNAVDALFALNFGVYGNVQTAEYISHAKTPWAIGWNINHARCYEEGTLLDQIGTNHLSKTYCQFNSPFFADVTKDCIVNAGDALLILQYSVGKDVDFPVNDFSSISIRFCYYPWPTEYYPGYNFENGPVTPTPTDVA